MHRHFVVYTSQKNVFVLVVWTIVDPSVELYISTDLPKYYINHLF